MNRNVPHKLMVYMLVLNLVALFCGRWDLTGRSRSSKTGFEGYGLALLLINLLADLLWCGKPSPHIPATMNSAKPSVSSIMMPVHCDGLRLWNCEPKQHCPSPHVVLQVFGEVTNLFWLLHSSSLICSKSPFTLTSISRERNIFRKVMCLFWAVLGRPGDFFFFFSPEANDLNVVIQMLSWGQKTYLKYLSQQPQSHQLFFPILFSWLFDIK